MALSFIRLGAASVKAFGRNSEPQRGNRDHRLRQCLSGPAPAHASGLEEEKLALLVVFEEMKSAESLRLTPLGNVRWKQDQSGFHSQTKVAVEPNRSAQRSVFRVSLIDTPCPQHW
jgi:hypothetical protein